MDTTPLKLFCYYVVSDQAPHIGVETPDGRFDLTSQFPDWFSSIAVWLGLPDPVLALRTIDRKLLDSVPDDIVILPPIGTSEVWAAGVTYERSRVARQEESRKAGGDDFYARVYDADRPEIFFKSAGWRVVGPGGYVAIRKDSTWNVPEPEMTLVISSSGKIVGITAGNDMSSRSIEGENPLYLPQAKTYDGACALGPSILIIDDPATLRNRTIALEITRDDAVIVSRETTTARLHRTPEELVEYLYRELSFPHGVFLMTGTGIVPDDDFTLRSGDRIAITIDGVGTLKNTVA